MDARTAESPVISQQDSWLQRERASGRFYDRLGWVIAVFLAGMMALSILVLRRGAEPGSLLSPPLIALLLILNLLPAIALMVLYARKVAVRRAEAGGLGSGRLHVRLVALFSVIAVVPTVLVAIFASLLFQSGLEFWFSNRARSMLEQYDEMLQLYGTHTGVNLARKHIGWYTKGLPGSAELRNRVNQLDNPDAVKAMLREFYAPWLSRAAA